eukprot:361748-Ditylum_brightwellii.AAC.1
MLRPTSVPTTIPAPTTAASTSLPHVHIIRSFTSNSGQSRQHNQRKFQPKKDMYYYNCRMPGMSSRCKSQLNIIDQALHHNESTCICSNNANIRDKSIHETVKQYNAKHPPQHGKPKRELYFKRKLPCLAVMPSPNVNSILISPDPQTKYYNIHDPPHITDNKEEDEAKNEDQSVTDNDNDDSDYEDPDDASQNQGQDTPPIQPSGMNINLPLPAINTMEHTIMMADRGSNGHILNDLTLLTTYITNPCAVAQISGDTANCLDWGLAFMEVTNSSFPIIPLWPCYYTPKNPQNTLSQQALKRHNHLKAVNTEAIEWLSITDKHNNH